MSRFFLVRHGTTEWNAQGRILGQSDPSLNETGRSQARRLGMRLSSVPFAE
ncbi:MAG: histidine phosphatase family protein, partial [Acidobacteriota bacterium]|nr:histidine phosphatase family protein [Acidobacteriota bacterium]